MNPFLSFDIYQHGSLQNIVSVVSICSSLQKFNVLQLVIVYLQEYFTNFHVNNNGVAIDKRLSIADIR